MSKLSIAPPSMRTRIRRLAELASYEKESLYSILDEAYACHVAFNDGKSTHCIPTAFWRIENYLYIHGSNGSRLAKALLSGEQASISIAHIDGLVLAKSAFSHTMNYRSAVIYGVFEQVRGGAKKMDALNAFMEKIAPGRETEARPGNDKELAATTVLRVPLDEVAVKISKSGPIDKPEDVDLLIWSGVLPLTVSRGEPSSMGDSAIPIPKYVSNWKTIN